jgi:uncharacterized protein (DUF2235 family)
MTRKIIVCIDGTGNQPSDLGGTRGDPEKDVTNVHRLRERLEGQSDHQSVAYVQGLATSGGKIRDFFSFNFGLGWNRKRDEARALVEKHYEPGDLLVLAGFSRGAAIARDLANELHDDGIDTSILALWESVGAFGLPTRVPFIPQSYNLGKRLGIPPCVTHVYHAVALDEIREPFTPTLCAPAQGLDLDEVWFAGDHVDVGGGRQTRALSDVTLEWMMRRLASHDIVVSPGPSPKPPLPVDVHRNREFKIQKERDVKRLDSGKPRLHRSVAALFEVGYEPLKLKQPLEEHYVVVD